MRKTVRAEKLALGDVVRLGDSSFMDAVVKNITPAGVTIVRPHMISQDFSYTGGVIVSIGYEEFVLQFGSNKTILLIEQKGTLK